MSVLCPSCSHVLDLGEPAYCSACGHRLERTISAGIRAQDRPTNPNQFADRLSAQARSEARRVESLARRPPIPRTDEDEPETSEATRAFRRASARMRALNPTGPHTGKSKPIARIKKDRVE